ncbi:16S rRNA (cytosine(1402)-N(4))-methyltransferase RsmH [Woeseiaceae bacterium]|nr:16S rRNA (cytosine(1402)-N(4))-methyltransferase RsmH [Woeseiaceae bacterium]
MSNHTHVPVLIRSVLNGLNIRPDGCYVDGTFGRGGHSSAIAKLLGPKGRMIMIDRDPEAIATVPDTLTEDPRFEIVKGEIAALKKIALDGNLLGKVDGLLLDLGVSSPQLDQAERGFSFMRDGFLDMRMDPKSGTSAAEWLSDVDEKTLKKILHKYADEKFAGPIARAIVAARSSVAIERTAQLAEVVAAVIPRRAHRKHPATKTFQAIRIHINDELKQLESALTASIDLLRTGGRLCVISFHSIEDRIIKRFMRNASREAEQYRGLPLIPTDSRPSFKLIGKPISATTEEIEANIRARSARLRIAERLGFKCSKKSEVNE